MFKLSPVIFVPDNPRYFARTVATNDIFMPLDEKIKNDPTMREKYRTIAKATGQFSQSTPTQRRTIPTRAPIGRAGQELTQMPITQFDDAQPISNADPNGSKTWIMNCTQADIIFDFCVANITASRDRRAIPKPPVLQRFMAISRLTPEQMQHPQLKYLESQNLVKFINDFEKAKYDEVYRQKDAAEKQNMERKRKLADYDRAMNPHRANDLRSLTGMSISEVDISVGGSDLVSMGIRPDAMQAFNDAVTGDGQKIKFAAEAVSVMAQGGNSKEENEMNALIGKIGAGAVDGGGVTDPADLSSMFTQGEYKE